MINTITLLNNCAAEFLSLAKENQRIADEEAKTFYHNRMAGKAASTYRQCASYLFSVAMALPPILASLPDDKQSKVNQYGIT
jgi:hypothetical protein